ncbi:MAG: hypothetical protein Q8P18_02285 [Pseudomonadota bacterium]|nr:hypothetical protein [Pseudomonadota bacterium]
MRFITPILFAAAAAYVGWQNGQHTDRVLVLPFLDVIAPATAGDAAAQGALTVQILFGLAVVFALWEGYRMMRDRQADDTPQ